MRRFDLEVTGQMFHTSNEMVEREDGDWVRWDDVEEFISEWRDRFGFLAQANAPDSLESIDEVAAILSVDKPLDPGV